MSSKVEGTTITMTRGDTFRTTVKMYEDAEQTSEYVPKDGDVVRFATKKKFKDTESVIFEEVIPNDTQVLTITPEDTKPMSFGKYVYDIQITYANGDVDTFIDKGTLIITEEVS
jgi:hypothetical protein